MFLICNINYVTDVWTLLSAVFLSAEACIWHEGHNLEQEGGFYTL